ncbi:MAG: DUF6036 family nucleotidyltransferase [Bryobacteraceae bacterium]
MVPEPWGSFFAGIDEALRTPVELHCIGGFAMAMLYGLPRPTADVDCLTVTPIGETAALEVIAGRGSALHNKYGIYVQHVGIVTVPENYAERLKPIFPKAYRRLAMNGLDAHDLALSKLERNSARDREDVRYLGKAVPLDPALLESRYRLELRPYLVTPERHDAVLRLWLEMLQTS